MSSIESEIATFAINGLPGLSLVAATNTFLGHMIPEPDNVTMFMEVAGPAQDEYLNTQYATIEIWTRDDSADNGKDRLQQIFEFLHRQGNVALGRYYLYFMHATTRIMDMDRDQMGRKMYKITFKAIFRDTNMIS